MRKFEIIKHVCITAILFALTGCLNTQNADLPDQIRTAQNDYEQLLTMFNEDNPALSTESLFPPNQQPMTCALVLSAETARYKYDCNAESRRRIRKAAHWLVENSDLDNDGKPGWGLPDAWDAFNDGSTNPANHPYTITTSFCLNALLDTLPAKSVWANAERQQMKRLIADVIVRWCSEVWSDGFGGGYFWYSPNPADDIFGINSPAMFMGSMSRSLHGHADIFTPSQRDLVRDRTDKLAKAVVATVAFRDSAPFWLYAPLPNKLNHNRPNDLLHHVYILWGAETYRDCGGTVDLTFTRQQAIESLSRFRSDSQIYEFPQDTENKNIKPARLWGIGMLLAFYANWGSQQQAAAVFEAIKNDYGTWPKLHLMPAGAAAEDIFYHRHAAHVLMGLALYAYPANDH